MRIFKNILSVIGIAVIMDVVFFVLLFATVRLAAFLMIIPNITVGETMSFSGGVLCSVIAALASVIIAEKQLNNHNKYHKDLQFDNKPYLYVFSTYKRADETLSIKMKNVGYNTALNLRIKQDNKCVLFTMKQDSSLTNQACSSCIIENNESIELSLKDTKNDIVTFYFDDVFNNHYYQSVNLNKEVTTHNPLPVLIKEPSSIKRLLNRIFNRGKKTVSESDTINNTL